SRGRRRWRARPSRCKEPRARPPGRAWRGGKVRSSKAESAAKPNPGPSIAKCASIAARMSFRGRELEHLIHPVSLADFFRDHWDKKPLYIPGRPEKYADIYDVECWKRGQGVGKIIAASADYGVQHEFQVEPGLVDHLYKAGLTICAEVTND